MPDTEKFLTDDTYTHIMDTIDQLAVEGIDVQIAGTSIVNEGVANIPKASDSAYGVVKYSEEGYNGIKNVSNIISTNPATDDEIKAGSSGYKPIAPASQHRAVFYGLAKAAGDTTQSESATAVGTYTDGAKGAVAEMLGLRLHRDNVAVESTTLAAGEQKLIQIPAKTGYIPLATRLVFTSQTGSTHTLCTSGILFQGDENRVRVFNNGSVTATFAGNLNVYYLPLTAFIDEGV